MTMSPWLASLLLVVVQATGAKSLVASKPATLEALDTGKLKGDPTQLAWSPDNSQLFLQTSERDSVGTIKNPRFYIIDAATGKMASVANAPEWAASVLGMEVEQVRARIECLRNRHQAGDQDQHCHVRSHGRLAGTRRRQFQPERRRHDH